MDEDKDPGIGGPKLSKSGNTNLEERNKSYEKVMDAMNDYIRALNNFDPNAGELGVRWMKKHQWHEKEFGW